LASDAGARAPDGSGRRSADRVGKLVEGRAILGTPDEVAEEWRIRPLAALMGGDAGELEERSDSVVLELELLRRHTACPRERIAGV
jgi:hypothetical protein